MRLRRTLVYVMWMTVFVGASACPLGPGTGRGESPPPRDDLTHAVNLVRLINTAEAEYRAGRGRYAKWGDLLASGVFDTVKGETARLTT